MRSAVNAGSASRLSQAAKAKCARSSGGSACELTELSFALHPWKFEPGVRKFRSLAEANQHRQEWEKKQVRRPL